MTKIKSVFETMAVLKPGLAIDQVNMSPGFYDKLDRDYNNFKDHVLIAAYEFSEDWGVWERHPKGEEIVMLVSGRAELVLRKSDGDETLKLDQSGAYAVVPRNIWHTAKVSELTRMLFITPGEGTEHSKDPAVPSE
ncbi:MAG: cupin domain-containing protein [Proteobacteria bacterium]|nr:cupin domain-containing protein [Pseudomonadota bacterium]